MWFFKKDNKVKIQIRQINDIQGNSYKIYDYMALDKFGLWRSVHTYFSMEEVREYHKNIFIEDKTTKNVEV